MSNPIIDLKELEFKLCVHINENEPENEHELERVLPNGSISLKNVTSCSTSVANRLSQQIIDEMNLIVPNVLVRFDHLNVSLGAAVFPYLQQPAHEALAHALRERGMPMKIYSAYRTIAQQLILFNHARNGRHGIKIAARPGRSNHQSGLAIDIDDAMGWKPYLERHGWRWLGQIDPHHFDYVGRGTRNIRSLAVLAFQKLWNQHNLSDRLIEDGLYGPQVEARLNQSPIEGFSVTPTSNQVRILKLTIPLMQGADVRELQEALVKDGFAIAVNGFYSQETTMAVRQFQARTGLAIDGVFGKASRRQLFQLKV